MRIAFHSLLIIGISGCLQLSAFAVSEYQKSTEPEYWKQYSVSRAPSQSVEKTVAPSLDRSGLRFGFSYEEMSTIKMAIAAFEVGWIKDTPSFIYNLDLSIGSGSVKDGMSLLLTDYTSLYSLQNVTCIRFNGGITYKQEAADIGVNVGFVGLSDSSNGTGLNGLSLGVELSKSYSMSSSMMLMPYVGVNYDLISTAKLPSGTGRISGLDGFGYSIGLRVNSLL